MGFLRVVFPAPSWRAGDLSSVPIAGSRSYSTASTASSTAATGGAPEIASIFERMAKPKAGRSSLCPST